MSFKYEIPSMEGLSDKTFHIFTVTPGKSVGPIHIGDSEQQIDNAIQGILKTMQSNVDPKIFKKTKDQKGYVKDYGICHVYFDASGKSEGIEFFDKTGFGCSYRTKLIPQTTSLLFMGLLRGDDGFVIENGSVVSKKVSIGISFNPERTQVSSVFVGKTGYFN